MELGGFRAWIAAKGEELPIYKVELSADGKTSICWIASEAGAEFSVNWKDTLRTRPTCITGTVHVDGFRCGARTTAPTNALRQASTSDFVVSAYTSRKLVFSVVKLTDDDTYLNKSRDDKLGDIELTLCRTRRKGRDVPALSVQDLPEDVKVHERSKKGLSHCVVFGEPVQSNEPFLIYNHVRLGKKPLATFTFKYRSLDILRANGIVPVPTPRPSLAINSSSSDAKRKRRASETPPRRVKREKNPLVKMDPGSDSDDVQIIEPPNIFQPPPTQSLASSAATPAFDPQCPTLLHPTRLPGPDQPLSQFCTDYELSPTILEKFHENLYRDARTLRFVTIDELKVMGFRLGEIASLRDAVDRWSLP